MVEDHDGKIIEDWFKSCKWEKIANNDKQSREGQNEVFQMCLPQNLQYYGETVVIGTIETGYNSCQKLVEHEKLFELLQYIAKKSLDIWQAQLPRVLEIIAEKVRQLLNADAATLHFVYEPKQQHGRYIYEVFSGGVGKQFIRACPPRKNGLGRQAVQDKKYKIIPDSSCNHNSLAIEKLNQKAFDAGIKAMAAFPLLIGAKEGVLYVLFRHEHKFNKRRLRFVESFVRRWAVDAVSYSTRIQEMRDMARWRFLNSITLSLSHITEASIPGIDLLHRIAWNSLNILRADIVTIYEYIQTEQQFITPPSRAGRLREEDKVRENINDQNVQFWLVKRGENFYSSRQEEEIFNNSSFIQREKIQSSAGILLKVGKHILGVMLINYRRPHNFSEDEIEIIETLSSSSAIAIQNSRSLIARDKINRFIITTINQNELLSFIVQEALKITGADVGGIYLLDSNTQELVTKVELFASTNDAAINSPERIGIDKGITGWVTEHAQSILVDNVQNDNRYYHCFPKMRSELCVPLLDSKRRVFGVLNVESRHTSMFNQKHQGMLEALANQAVIGITQDLEKKEQLVKTKTMAAIGNLAGPLVHRMNNGIGAIRSWVQDIIDDGDADSKKKATQILSVADQLIQETVRLQSWQEQPQSVNLFYALNNALSQMDIPLGITLNINIPTDLPTVLGIEQHFIYIFDNLIQNAVEAMRQGGTISINGTLVQRDVGVGIWVEIRVCDTGVGIARENWGKIFEFGYTTKDAKKGMGFGLWWTKLNIEQLLGGIINVESTLGQGSQFTLLLPTYNKLETDL